MAKSGLNATQNTHLAPKTLILGLGRIMPCWDLSTKRHRSTDLRDGQRGLGILPQWIIGPWGLPNLRRRSRLREVWRGTPLH